MKLTKISIVLSLSLMSLACGDNNTTPTNVLASSQANTDAATGITPAKWPLQKSPLVRDPAIEVKIAELLAKMTVEEKVGQIIQADIVSVTPAQVKQYHLGSILNGGNSAPGQDNRVGAQAWLELADQFWQASTDKSNGRTGIPAFWGTDAVHGHSNVVGATIFPHNIGLGAANDPELMKKVGEITAKEMLVTGLDWTFAPTIAVARDDRWGRTYESYSEHPEIIKQYVGKILEGIQGKVGTNEYLDQFHMLATVKHFLGDGGTFNGKDQGDNRASEAELRDIHGSPYPEAIKAGAQVVMASYNSWHGMKMHGYKDLLTDVLVGRMGLDGFVVGDWNGHGQVAGCKTTACAASLNAGLDLFMAPDSWKELYENTLTQVQEGDISIERLNQAVARILRVKLRMGLFDAGLPSTRLLAGKYELLGNPEHRAVAREAVRKSLVLLKNNDQLLPIPASSHVLIAGDGAHNIGKQSGGWTLSWQGTGNTNDNFPNGTSIYQGISAAIEAGGGQTTLSQNGDFTERPDIAVVVFGEEPYAEFQGDRAHVDFEDDRGLMLLAKFKQQKIPTVAVFISGRPMWVNPELNQSDAFVATWLPGTEGGGIADVIVQKPDGGVNYDFQGKLSFSWPQRATDTQVNIGDENYQPLFAYGYGLDYGSPTDQKKLYEESGLNPNEIENMIRYVFSGKAVMPWQIELLDQGITTIVENSTQVSSKRALTLSAADRDQQEDTSIINWHDKGIVVVSRRSRTDIDISRQTRGDMALEIEYQVLKNTSANIRLGMACGHNCGGHLTMTDDINKRVGRGWQTSHILLSCFVDKGAKMDKITAPVVIASDAGLELQIANIGIVPDEGNANCGL